MKKMLIIGCALLFFSCATTKSLNTNSSCYRVFKIKSLESVYIIYTKKDGKVYHIISERDSTEILQHGERIRRGKRYAFKLKSEEEVAPVIDGVKLYPMNAHEIYCDFDGTLIRLSSIYYPDNVKGLIYLGD